MRVLSKISFEQRVLIGLWFLLDAAWKFMSLIFIRDSCHGAGGDPNRRICEDTLVPFWLSLSIPLLLDTLLIGSLIAVLDSSPGMRLHPVLRTAIKGFVPWLTVLLSGL